MLRVKNSRYVIIQTGKQGNGEGTDISNAELWQSYLRELLRSVTAQTHDGKLDASPGNRGRKY